MPPTTEDRDPVWSPPPPFQHATAAHIYPPLLQQEHGHSPQPSFCLLPPPLSNLHCLTNVGEVLGVLGCNGTGKTTAVSIICGDMVPNFGQKEFQELIDQKPWSAGGDAGAEGDHFIPDPDAVLDRGRGHEDALLSLSCVASSPRAGLCIQNLATLKAESLLSSGTTTRPSAEEVKFAKQVRAAYVPSAEAFALMEQGSGKTGRKNFTTVLKPQYMDRVRQDFEVLAAAGTVGDVLRAILPEQLEVLAGVSSQGREDVVDPHPGARKFGRCSLTASEIAEILTELGIVGAGFLEAQFLPPFFRKPISALSGGELQRLAIATACLQDANLYVFDEPSSFLDAKQRLAAARCIRKISTRPPAYERRVLVVEHDLVMFDYLCDKAHLQLGQSGRVGFFDLVGPAPNKINAFLRGDYFLPCGSRKLWSHGIGLIIM